MIGALAERSEHAAAPQDVEGKTEEREGDEHDLEDDPTKITSPHDELRGRYQTTRRRSNIVLDFYGPLCRPRTPPGAATRRSRRRIPLRAIKGFLAARARRAI